MDQHHSSILEKLVIIPTFNEKENIENIIAAVIGLQQNYHVLIIDDNSPDGTAEIIKLLSGFTPIFWEYTNKHVDAYKFLWNLIVFIFLSQDSIPLL